MLSVSIKISLSKNILVNKYASQKNETKEIWKGYEVGIVEDGLPSDTDLESVLTKHRESARKEINDYFTSKSS